MGALKCASQPDVWNFCVIIYTRYMEDAMLSLSNLRVEIQEESPSRYISSLFFLFFILSKFESMYETLHKRFYISFLHLRI